MSLNIKFSYLAENSKFSRSNSYFSVLTPTFLRDGFLNSCFQNPSENSAIVFRHLNSLPYLTKIWTSTTYYPMLYGCNNTVSSRYDMYRDTFLTIRYISRYYFNA